MKTITVLFKGTNYQVSTGDVFQAKLNFGIPGQIFIVQHNNDEKVILECIEKVSNYISIMRVNEIEYKEKGVIKKENYQDTIKEPDYEEKPLDEMTKKELIEFCNKNNINGANTKMKKDDIINIIKEVLK